MWKSNYDISVEKKTKLENKRKCKAVEKKYTDNTREWKWGGWSREKRKREKRGRAEEKGKLERREGREKAKGICGHFKLIPNAKIESESSLKS